MEFVRKSSRQLLGLSKALNFVEHNEVKCCNVTMRQCFTILAFSENQNPSMSDLSDALGLAPSTVTRVIDNLVRDNFLERKQAKGDRRTVQVSLTRTGKQKARELEKCFQSFWHDVFDRIPENRRNEVSASLELLTDAMAQSRPGCCGTNHQKRECCDA